MSHSIHFSFALASPHTRTHITLPVSRDPSSYFTLQQHLTLTMSLLRRQSSQGFRGAMLIWFSSYLPSGSFSVSLIVINSPIKCQECSRVDPTPSPFLILCVLPLQSLPLPRLWWPPLYRWNPHIPFTSYLQTHLPSCILLFRPDISMITLMISLPPPKPLFSSVPSLGDQHHLPSSATHVEVISHWYFSFACPFLKTVVTSAWLSYCLNILNL